MPTTQEISDYVTGLASATLAGTEEVYLATDEKTTTQDIADLNGGMKYSVVNIGDWDMDATASVNVTHGIADYSKIRSVNVLIIPDAATTLIPLNTSFAGGVPQGSVGQIQSSTLPLYRTAGGTFDSVNYDSTSFNRGYVTIGYVD